MGGVGGEKTEINEMQPHLLKSWVLHTLKYKRYILEDRRNAVYN